MTLQQPENDQATDEQLVAQIAAGDEQSKAAFFMLYERYERLTLAFIRTRVARSDADDLQQEIWVKVWGGTATFQGGNYRAWLLTIASRHIIDHYRKQRRMHEATSDFDEKAAPTEDTPLDVIIDQEVKRVFASCLERLDQPSKQVVQRRLVGDPYDDICKELEITEAKAHKLLFHAKAQLRTCVEVNSQ